MSKVIAIEAQRIFRKKKGGMDVVVLEIIRELQKIDKVNRYYILVAPGPDRCLEPTGNFTIVEIPGNFYPLWEQYLLVKALRKISPDIVHCTSNTAPLFWRGKMLLTLHDIIFLEKLEGRNSSRYQQMGRIYRRLFVPPLLRRDIPLITVSNSEKEHIRHALGIADSRIRVIYNACSDHFYRRDFGAEPRENRAIPDQYFLALGNTDPRKNMMGLLRAYRLYRSFSPNPIPLVITALSAEELQQYLLQLDASDLTSHIILPGFVSWKDLPWWYSGAVAFLYISLREGFGIPILESMACGTPVLTSSISSMPEVAGSNGLLADPFMPDQIADWLLRLETDESLREAQSRYGLERVKHFSWRKSAEQVLSLYRDL